MAILALTTALFIPSSAAAEKGSYAHESTTTTPITTTSTTSTTVPPPLVSPEIMAKWQKVAQCESGQRWYQVHYGSHSFSGALGIRNDVWIEHGGGEFGPTAGHASPMEQVIVARRIQARGGVPDYVPDQDGVCRGW